MQVDGKKDDKLIQICKKVNATHYLSGLFCQKLYNSKKEICRKQVLYWNILNMNIPDINNFEPFNRMFPFGFAV